MDKLFELGKQIREKRLKLNLRMDDVAKEANISRQTLSAIENGKGNCSLSSLWSVMGVLDISLTINNSSYSLKTRDRASRVTTSQDKKINRFIIMCVEEYASQNNESSASTYKKLKENGIIADLLGDYEDLHGMSSNYLNDYICELLED